MSARRVPVTPPAQREAFVSSRANEPDSCFGRHHPLSTEQVRDVEGQFHPAGRAHELSAERPLRQPGQHTLAAMPELRAVISLGRTPAAELGE